MEEGQAAQRDHADEQAQVEGQQALNPALLQAASGWAGGGWAAVGWAIGWEAAGGPAARPCRWLHLFWHCSPPGRSPSSPALSPALSSSPTHRPVDGGDKGAEAVGDRGPAADFAPLLPHVCQHIVQGARQRVPRLAYLRLQALHLDRWPAGRAASGRLLPARRERAAERQRSGGEAREERWHLCRIASGAQAALPSHPDARLLRRSAQRRPAMVTLNCKAAAGTPGRFETVHSALLGQIGLWEQAKSECTARRACICTRAGSFQAAHASLSGQTCFDRTQHTATDQPWPPALLQLAAKRRFLQPLASGTAHRSHHTARLHDTGAGDGGRSWFRQQTAAAQVQCRRRRCRLSPPCAAIAACLSHPPPHTPAPPLPDALQAAAAAAAMKAAAAAAVTAARAAAAQRRAPRRRRRRWRP